MVNSSRRKVLGLAAAGVALTVTSGRGFAQAYPTKPIRLIVPYPPGGGTDTFARTISGPMGNALGQTIVVENRPGAATIIGAQEVARSDPDGYTVLLGDNATYAVNPSLYRKLPYDPQKDFDPVTLTGRFLLLLVAHPSAKIDSVKELVARAKAKPGELNYGSPGNGSPHHLAMEMFAQRAGIKLTHVPYKGGAPATQDLLAGRIPVMFLDLTTALAHLKAGKIKALAAASPKRSGELPDVPTIAESGYAGYEAWAWQGFAVPDGTPQPVIQRLNGAFAKAAADPAVRKRLGELGLELTPSTPQEMADYVKSETAKWAKIIKEANVTVE